MLKIIGIIVLILVGLFLGVLTLGIFAACMLSSKISQQEEKRYRMQRRDNVGKIPELTDVI